MSGLVCLLPERSYSSKKKNRTDTFCYASYPAKLSRCLNTSVHLIHILLELRTSFSLFSNISHPYSLNPFVMSLQETNALQTIYDAFLRKSDLAPIPWGWIIFSFSFLLCCQKNILICNLWLEEWQTDRHMCTVHICFPALDLRSTVELQRRGGGDYNRWFSLRSWDETLCVASALWSFFSESPIGSGSPAGLHSNVLRPIEYMGMRAYSHMHTQFFGYLDVCSHLFLHMKFLGKVTFREW